MSAVVLRLKRMLVRGRSLAAAGLSGMLCGLAGPTFGLWPVAAFALLPWFSVGVKGAERDTGLRARLLQAFVFGFVVTLFNDWVLARAMRMFFGLPWRYALLALLAVCLVQALVYLPLGAALYLLRRLGVSWSCGWVSAWLFSEWAFPRTDRMGLGTALVDAPWVSQFAELGGVGLLTLFVIGSNLAWTSIWASTAAARRGRWLGAWVLSVVALAGLGGALVQRVRGRLEGAPTLTLAALQPAGELYPTDSRRAEERGWLRDQTARLGNAGVVLALWPESSLRTTVPADLRDAGAYVPYGVAVWFGASSEAQREGGPVWRTSVFAADREGQVEARYDKWGLVPFAEYVPAWASFADELLRFHEQPGRGPHALAFRDHRLGVSICYEDMLGAEMRTRVAAERPELLVNFTNDRWFDDEKGAETHLRLARMRAIELGRDLVRATSTGVTAHIDPTGRVVKQLPQRRPGVLVARARLLQHQTVYVERGEWAYASAALWVALGLVYRRRQAPEGAPGA